MSKAFTKDDAPEAAPIFRRRAHLPAGTPNYVTARGLRALREELARLTAAAFAVIGDAQAHAAWRAELEERVATAVLVEPPEPGSDLRGEARFGATVRLRDAAGRARAVRIVGVDEADAAHGFVAFTAPLARALLGRRAGDVVSVSAPGGEEEVEVVEVAWE
jgi:transcription elongation factor GreB